MPPDYIYELPPAVMYLTVLCATALLALGLHVAFKQPALRRMSDNLADLSPVVMTLCGTLFVLSVTFLANSIWQMEDRARETINSEARSLQVMRTYMEMMTGPSRDSFQRIIVAYGEAVAVEWPDMRLGNSQTSAEPQLQNLYSAVVNGFSEGDHNRLLQQRMLAALDQLSTARQQRLSMAQNVVSVGQWFLVSALGLLFLVMIALGHGRFPKPRAAALAAITFAVSVALFVIVSHDRPFVGYQALTPHAILMAAGATR